MVQISITIPSPAAAISLLPANMKDFQIAGFILQPDDGATNPMFVGDAAVAAVGPYMFRLNAPAGGVPPAPVVYAHGGGTGICQASQLYVIGTAGEILRGALIPR